MLLAAGADVNAKSSVRSRNCRTHAVACADASRLRVPAQEGDTALCWAASGGHAAVAAALVSRGADAKLANNVGATPMHLASQKGHAPVVALLLKLHDSAAVDVRDRGGRTALHFAGQNGRSDVVKLLLQAGASRTARSNVRALRLKALACKRGVPERMADPRSRNPLICADRCDRVRARLRARPPRSGADGGADRGCPHQPAGGCAAQPVCIVQGCQAFALTPPPGAVTVLLRSCQTS